MRGREVNFTHADAERDEDDGAEEFASGGQKTIERQQERRRNARDLDGRVATALSILVLDFRQSDFEVVVMN